MTNQIVPGGERVGSPVSGPAPVASLRSTTRVLRRSGRPRHHFSLRGVIDWGYVACVALWAATLAAAALLGAEWVR